MRRASTNATELMVADRKKKLNNYRESISGGVGASTSAATTVVSVQELTKLVRSRLTPEENHSLRVAFEMFANKKSPDTLKAKKLWNVTERLDINI